MADGGISAGDASGAAALVVAAGGFLGMIGKGFAWLWRQRRRRIAQLEAALDELREEFRRMARECADERIDNVRRIDCLVTVCVVLIDDVETSNPGSRSIDRARQLLGAEFPDLLRRTFPAADQVHLPADMIELARRGSEALRQI